MRCYSLYSHHLDENEAINDCFEQLADEQPSFLVVYYTEEYSAPRLVKALNDYFPNTPIQGCSSCKGVMTDNGFHRGPVVSLFVIIDSAPSAYGTGIAPFNVNMTLDCDTVTQALNQSVVHALENAFEQAQRKGEIPALLLLHATPGYEEQIIASIDRFFGAKVPLIGGTAADHQVQGRWSILTQDTSYTRGVCVTLLFPSQPIATQFNSGYTATTKSGTVTKAVLREVLEIDRRPAATVYQEWLDEHRDEVDDELNFFEQTSMNPLGRLSGQLFNQRFYKLTHPVHITARQGIHLFSTIEEGDRVWLMQGSLTHLKKRAAQQSKQGFLQFGRTVKPLGVINILCAGSMLTLADEMEDVYRMIKTEMADEPFICPFTFGEQGQFINGDNGHGNLMVSTATIYRYDD